MPATRNRRPAAAPATLAALLLALAACDDSGQLNGPGANGDAQFSQEISLPELEGTVSDGPSRWEIKLLPGTLTAREVEVERPEKLADREEIESRITGISVVGGDGTLDLAIDALQVQFNTSTRFKSESGDITFDEFVNRVQAALAAGGEPAVEAKREAPAEPQDPDDPTFLATQLELDDEAGEPKIEMNVDSDNLELNDNAGATDPDGWVTVLNLRIELRVSEGITKLEEETSDASGSTEFEGIVASVQLDDAAGSTGSVTLSDGTIVLVVSGTEIDDGSNDGDDDDEHLTSLQEVQAALDAGLIVEADGKGVLESMDPRTITAIEVEFEIEDDADDIPGPVEFEDNVTSVDLAAGTVTLAGGTVVRVTDGIIDPEGDLLTLQAVSDAVNAGQPVRAEGHATVESVGPPAVLDALDVKFELGS